LWDEIRTGENVMKIKALAFVSCLAAGALIWSAAFSKPAKKPASSSSRSQQTAARTTQAPSRNRYQLNPQNVSSHKGSTRYYRATRYTGTRYYYGGGSYPYYSYYSGWPYSNWGYGTSWGYNPYSYWDGYPYSSYNNYSYYMPTYGYNASLVASVQRRLGQLGYYHGVVDGVIGPQTHGAIPAFEDRNGLVVDGRITRPLLDTLRLG
jgi:Putative peptidoglycan binding domain